MLEGSSPSSWTANVTQLSPGQQLSWREAASKREDGKAEDKVQIKVVWLVSGKKKKNQEKGKAVWFSRKGKIK